MSERWVKVAAAADESVALLMDGVLKDAGIPSLIQRAAGFDAPESLSAGPRDVPADLFTGIGSVGQFFFYLGYLNVVLALFNLIPAFPLDGGGSCGDYLQPAWEHSGRQTSLRGSGGSSPWPSSS